MNKKLAMLIIALGLFGALPSFAGDRKDFCKGERNYQECVNADKGAKDVSNSTLSGSWRHRLCK